MKPINKVVLLIVEGETDERTLGLALKRAYRKKDIRFFVCHSDMTTETGNTYTDVKNEIIACIRRFLSTVPFLKPHDIAAVVQLTDTDGVYIPEDCVIEGKNDQNVYELDHILAHVRQNILERNKQKSSILTSLSKRRTITYHECASDEELGDEARYLYRIYYMSCNLEHVLHDKLNQTQEEKGLLADSFEKQCSQNPEHLEEILFHPAVHNSTSYEESWQYITKGSNSLKRKSNFGYFIDEFMK